MRVYEEVVALMKSEGLMVWEFGNLSGRAGMIFSATVGLRWEGACGSNFGMIFGAGMWL